MRKLEAASNSLDIAINTLAILADKMEDNPWAWVVLGSLEQMRKAKECVEVTIEDIMKK